MRSIGSGILALALYAGACGGQSAGDYDGRGDGAGKGVDQGSGGEGNTDSPGETHTNPQPTPEFATRANPGYGYYTVDGDSITFSWGNMDRTCGDSSLVECNEAKAEVTLSLQQLSSQRDMDLQFAQGVMTSSGVNEGGQGPNDCWWGGGSPWGEFKLLGYRDDDYMVDVSGTGLLDDPNVDGRFIFMRCN